jgi:hypothetical protein
MNPFKIVGKYLDQPILVAKFERKVPYLLAGGGALYTAHTVKKSEKENQSKTLLRVGTTMLFTVLTALAAPKIANKVFKNETKNLLKIKEENTQIIDKFISENNIDSTTKNILNKAKEKALSFNEIKQLYEKSNKNTEFLNKLIPEPENISSKEIFSEIGRLSLLGLIPVIGGIFGGIAGDIVASENWKEKVPNKIKEGAYQYLANIFLCNVGAGIALGIMEKFGVKNKSTRALGMIGGILTTGVIGGSAIANLIGNKIINPIFGTQKNNELYGERKPEALDIGLHTDDIATVAVMSGLKWIEPALPIMYAISGYRAGIGYRNVNICKENNGA